MAMNQSIIFVAAAAALSLVGVIGVFLHVGGILDLLFALLASLAAVMVVLFYKYGYIFVPLITQQTRTVLLPDAGYEVQPSQDVITKKSDGGYAASIFLAIRIYESASEKSMEQNLAYNEYFERAISNLKFVAKISYLLYVEDVSDKKRIIESRRADAQVRLAQEKDKPEPDVLKLDRYEREVSKWDNELNKLIKGVKPMGAIAYAMCTGTGITKESAIATARNQANELKAVLTNALNVEIEPLSGSEMLKTFEWEKMIPAAGQEAEEVVV
ncbi:Uncharacterised protein [uncultured archaeon]|nr:Uncharacterised protein [uncultured archaeon]